jgi:hypothetical protein
VYFIALVGKVAHRKIMTEVVQINVPSEEQSNRETGKKYKIVEASVCHGVGECWWAPTKYEVCWSQF